MFHTINWQNSVHDPCFWAVRYYCDGIYRKFPGVTREESISYYENLVGNEQDLKGTEAEEMEEGWTLSITFPEGYTWQMDYSTEDKMDIATYHFLLHPTLYPEGVCLAIEGADDHLPGLRWAELKQIATCLVRHWQGDFDVNAIVPLLYPIVKWIAFDELEDVRQTLATMWQKLRVLDVYQVNQWLDEFITVYDKGQILRMNKRKEWEAVPWNLGYGGDLWVQTDEGWKTFHSTSIRSFEEDSRQFLPFFSMLERYS